MVEMSLVLGLLYSLSMEHSKTSLKIIFSATLVFAVGFETSLQADSGQLSTKGLAKISRFFLQTSKGGGYLQDAILNFAQDHCQRRPQETFCQLPAQVYTFESIARNLLHGSDDLLIDDIPQTKPWDISQIQAFNFS